MKRASWLAWIMAVAVWQAGFAFSLAMEPLVELARPGPWAGVSGLIAYDARLYLVNSEIFVNHNAADVYSYHPGEGELRFERRLFSQDAGTPAIIDGLLYWPYEDPRFSSAYGEYSITDGQQWRWQATPDLRGFHVHAMLAHQGAMYALASGWRGRLYRSTDHGRRWTLLYEHPSPEGRVSRITAMAAHAETLYLGLTAWAEAGVKLLYHRDGAVASAPGWPTGRSIGALSAFQGRIYAVNRTNDDSRLWRSDGRGAAEPIAVLDGHRVRALAATAEALWAVSAASGQTGIVWRSADGLQWREMQKLPEPPVALTVVEDQVFVGTHHRVRGGALWGPATPRAFAATAAPTPLSAPAVQLYTPSALADALRDLDQALTGANRSDYRQRLIQRLLPLALSRDPAAGQALSRRLQTSLPQTTVPLFGGKVQAPVATLARWYLLYAIALNGHGWAPPAFLTAPWTAAPNTAEKYLEPLLAAAWAVAELGQATPDTIDALQTALTSEALPRWAQGDLLAALHRLTGRPFRYPGGGIQP